MDNSLPRRNLFRTAAALSTSLMIPAARAGSKKTQTEADIAAEEHWAVKRIGSEQVNLFMWRKRMPKRASSAGTILFIHGSSMAGTPVFDLQVPGKPEYSTMDYFARLGFDTWCLDHEGYGRSSKTRNINCDISNGADDIAAATDYILNKTKQQNLYLYGLSSGALRAALFTERFPDRVKKIALDAFVWTGEGSPTLENRRKNISEWKNSNRRPIDLAMVESIFTRDHPGTADPVVVKAFAEAVLKLDSSVPTGTYLDMSANLPVCQPERLVVPTLIMRGQFDGIAGFQDVLNYFAKLPHPDKRFVVMQGIAHSSLHEKNVAIVHSVLRDFFCEPAPQYQA